MANIINLFKATTGLNNKIDPVRLDFDPKTGVTDLSIAYNISIDKTGRPSRRDGYDSVVSGSYHSLFSCGSYGLCILGTSLYVLESDYSTTSIATVTSGAKMAYVKHFDVTYFCNGYEKGKVTDRVYSTWIASSYVGPDTTKTVSDPPIGTILELWNGRMYIGKDDVLWYSNPFAYSQFDLARNYVPFGNQMRMIQGVKNGLFIGTDNGISFLGGSNPNEFSYEFLTDSRVIEGADVKVKGSIINPQIQGFVALIPTNNGIFAGLPTGELFDLTKERIDFPYSLRGAGIVKDNTYIITLQQ